MYERGERWCVVVRVDVIIRWGWTAHHAQPATLESLELAKVSLVSPPSDFCSAARYLL
jgi:hypothetical protein